MTDGEILKIDQTATASRQVRHEGDLVVWTADLPGNEHALAAFNLGESPIALDRPWSDFGVYRARHTVQNAWNGERLGASPRLHISLEPHASIVLVFGTK